MTERSDPPTAMACALPSIRSPSPPLGSTELPLVDRPAMSGSTTTWVALPATSIPLRRFPENTFVRTSVRLLLPVISTPSFPFGAAPLNACRPPKVLKVTNPRARPVTSMPLRPLPADTFPSGITPPTCVLAEFPSTRMPSARFATIAVLFAPVPKKLPCTTTLGESVTRSPLRWLPLTTL